MLRPALLLAGLLFAAAPAVAESRSYPFKDFTKLDISAVYDVELVQGPKYSVEIDSRYNNFESIVVEQKGDTLRIRRPNGSIHHALKDVVRITAPDLNEIDLSAVVNLSTQAFHVKQLRLVIDSASTFKADDLKADDLMIKVKAGATIKLAGQCKTAFVEAQAGASLRASDFACREMGVKAEAGAAVDVRAEDKLVAVAKQGSHLNVSGNPKTIDKYADRGSFISVPASKTP